MDEQIKSQSSSLSSNDVEKTDRCFYDFLVEQVEMPNKA